MYRSFWKWKLSFPRITHYCSRKGKIIAIIRMVSWKTEDTLSICLMYTVFTQYMLGCVHNSSIGYSWYIWLPLVNQRYQSLPKVVTIGRLSCRPTTFAGKVGISFIKLIFKMATNIVHENVGDSRTVVLRLQMSYFNKYSHIKTYIFT
jgi:hypothetical protein